MLVQNLTREIILGRESKREIIFFILPLSFILLFCSPRRIEKTWKRSYHSSFSDYISRISNLFFRKHLFSSCGNKSTLLTRPFSLSITVLPFHRSAKIGRLSFLWKNDLLLLLLLQSSLFL